MDEFIKMVESNDPNAMRKYITNQFSIEIKPLLDKLVEEEFNSMLKGDGGYELLEEELNGMLKGDGGYLVPLGPMPSLLDFSSYHPSMGYRSLKPRNHYERMMARRKYGQRKTRRTR